MPTFIKLTALTTGWDDTERFVFKPTDRAIRVNLDNVLDYSPLIDHDSGAIVPGSEIRYPGEQGCYVAETPEQIDALIAAAMQQNIHVHVATNGEVRYVPLVSS